jgi:16S rRNA (uracil1498-N3)-methyltransferase
MRLHRFFSAEQITTKVESRDQNDTSDLITQKLATDQWRRVFRFGPGDRVIIFDGSGKDYICEIKEYKGENKSGGDETVLRVLETRENNVKPIRDVSLYAAVVKKDTFEWITEKATELGVSSVVPVMAERSEKKNINKERLEKISIEASEQSGRGTIPNISSIVDFADAVAEASSEMNQGEKRRATVAFDPSGVKFSRDNFPAGDVAVFVGPEGGWSPDELKAFEARSIPIFSLGPQILRAETAVVAALAQLMF